MGFGITIGSESKVLLAVAIAYVIIQFAFFPTMYLSIDEHEYIKNAFLLRNGEIGTSDPGYACRADLHNANGYVSKNFIGRSIFLIPFTFFGLGAIMLSGILIHLINLFIFVMILRRLKIPELFALLYLFFPALLWSARTVYPELLVLTGFLAGFYFFLGEKQRDHLLCGFFFSLAVLMRYDAIFGFGAFALPSLLKNPKKAALMLAGAAPVGLFILAFNTIAYSGPLNIGYAAGTSQILNSLSHKILNVLAPDHIFYLVLLLAFYPLMIISPYISKKVRWLWLEFLLITMTYFVLNFTTSFTAFNFSIQTTFTARLRYLIPLIGLLIIPYSAMLSEILESSKVNLPKPIIALAIIVMLAFAGILSMEHSALISTRTGVLDAIYSNTSDGSTVIGSSDDCIYFLQGLFPPRKYYSVDLSQDIARNPQNLTLENIKTNDTYVMQLAYGNLAGRASERQGVVDAERGKMALFVKANSGSLSAVYWSSYPNSLTIYKWG